MSKDNVYILSPQLEKLVFECFRSGDVTSVPTSWMKKLANNRSRNLFPISCIILKFRRRRDSYVAGGPRRGEYRYRSHVAEKSPAPGVQ